MECVGSSDQITLSVSDLPDRCDNGRYADLRSPEALKQELWQPRFGRHEDPIAALRSVVELRCAEHRRLGYVLAVGETRESVERLLDQTVRVDVVDRALDEVRSSWRERLATHRMETPEPSLNYLANDWLRYQAISGRIWGRCGYYQQSGAYGFRGSVSSKAKRSTFMPGKSNRRMSSLTSGVMTPRSSAMRGS